MLPWENKTVLAGEKGLKSILPIPLQRRRPQTNTMYKNKLYPSQESMQSNLASQARMKKCDEHNNSEELGKWKGTERCQTIKNV